MADALAGSGQLFNEIPMSALYAGANLVRDYAIPMYNKGREIAQTAVKDSKLAELYNRKDESGQQVMPKEEDLLNVYSSVGDEEGMKRMQKRIDEREVTYQETQDAIYLKQIENAKANGQYDLIPKILDSRNADSRLVNRTGKFNFDPNLGTFDRPSRAGEEFYLPDGTKFVGDGITKVKMGKDKSGQYRVVGLDDSDKIAYLKIQAAQQKAAGVGGTGKIPVGQIGTYSMAQNANSEIKELATMSPEDIKKAYLQAPDDKSSKVNTALYAATDAWLRIQTGSQANPDEIAKEMKKYQPRLWDSDDVVRNKLQKLYNPINRYLDNIETVAYGEPKEDRSVGLYSKTNNTRSVNNQIEKQKEEIKHPGSSRIKSIKIVNRAPTNQQELRTLEYKPDRDGVPTLNNLPANSNEQGKLTQL